MSKRLVSLVALLVVSVLIAPGAVAATTEAASTAQHGATATQQDDCTYPQTLTDFTGTDVEIPEEPSSIVALQPSDAQLVTEIGATDRMVGMPVGPYTSHLDAPDNVTDISGDDGVTPVAEKVIDLDADVVIAANTVTFQEGLVEQLRDADQTVYVYDSASSIEDVKQQVRTAGTLTGECDGADETVTEMEESLAQIDEVTEGEDEPLAFYVMGENDLTTPGPDTFQGEILDRAGVENIAERANVSGWQEISEEVIIEEDPEWIIYGDYMGEPPAMDALQSTTAWEQEQFVAVDSNAMSQPGPHVVEAIEQIASEVHADSYAEVTGNQSNTADSDDGNDSTADDDGSTAEDDADVIPGFGVAAALVALLSAIGARVRLH